MKQISRAIRGLMAVVPALLTPPASAQESGPLPPGPGANLVYAKCQQCHPINYVTDSAGLPDFLWRDTLNLMKQLGMQVTEEEEETIFEYLTTYLGTDPPPEPEPESDAAGADVDGAAVYAESCAVCHGPRGQGTAGAFPPLAGHAARLAQADRSYLPRVVLYGVSGPIEVDGQSYNGVMPAWNQLSDEQIAALLNTVISGWARDRADEETQVEPYAPHEIEAARGADLSAAAVGERRPVVP